MREILEEWFERGKETIDNDLEIFHKFVNHKRFIQLERSWIRNYTHKLMPGMEKCKKNVYAFSHNERAKLRKKLLKYLNQKIKSK